MASERGLLGVSGAAALAIGVVALFTALATGSGAILVDSAFNLCFFGTALLTLRVATLVGRPDDARFPFGYLHLEPLVNMVKGLLILGVGLIALIDAAFSIYRGGNQLSAGLALAYAAFATAFCAGVLVVLRRGRRRVKSPLLDGDIDNWLVNVAISLGMLAAFCLALLLQRVARDQAARYVDPVLVSLVVVLTIGVPVRMTRGALMGLLKRAPDEAVTRSVERLIRGSLGGQRMRALYVRVARPGRTTYVLAHVLLDEAEGALEVRRADALRRAAVDALVAAHAPVIADIVFTTVESFAAPTVGFAAASSPVEPVA